MADQARGVRNEEIDDETVLDDICRRALLDVMLVQSQMMRLLDAGAMQPKAEFAELFEDVANRLLDVSERISLSLAVPSQQQPWQEILASHQSPTDRT